MFARSRDVVNLISASSAKRLWNLGATGLSYLYSTATGSAAHAGFPAGLAIEPTTHCNLACPECPSGRRLLTRPGGSIDTGLFRKIIREASPHAFYLTLYFQGEPYMNHSIFEMITYAKSHRMYVSASTNGHFLDNENARKTVESGLDRLIISLDGADQETYTAYRKGGDISRVLEGLYNLTKWREKLHKHQPYIIVQCLVFRHNEEQRPAIRSLAYENGADRVVFKTAQLGLSLEAPGLIPINSRYSRYFLDRDGILRIRKKMKNRCYRMWSSTVVTWDGKVVPCCYDKDAQHMLGDLAKNDFLKIWKSESYRNFRNEVILNRKGMDICRNCSG